ncbi:hypothetical protein [Actinacidiphila glaucinigra]|nr:hypothetical protein [Actinacidiphila glaucinigra]
MRSLRVGTADFERPIVLGVDPAHLAGAGTDRRRTALPDDGLPHSGVRHMDHAAASGTGDLPHPHAGYVAEAEVDRLSRHRLDLGRA